MYYRMKTSNLLICFLMVFLFGACSLKSTIIPRPIGWSQTVIAMLLPDEVYGKSRECGGIYSPNELIATHPDLPCGQIVRIEHGKRFAIVRIGGRWPKYGMTMGLTQTVAAELEIDHQAKVRIVVLASK